jgi:hypothetical protein
VVTQGDLHRNEVLADDMTRQLKAGLSNEVGIYLNFDPERTVAPAALEPAQV